MRPGFSDDGMESHRGQHAVDGKGLVQGVLLPAAKWIIPSDAVIGIFGLTDCQRRGMPT